MSANWRVRVIHLNDGGCQCGQIWSTKTDEYVCKTFCGDSFLPEPVAGRQANAQFIATANPAAILSLLADIRRLEGEVKTMRNSVLEEAAKKCEALPVTIYKTGIYFEQCARAIRKMQF